MSGTNCVSQERPPSAVTAKPDASTRVSRCVPWEGSQMVSMAFLLSDCPYLEMAWHMSFLGGIVLYFIHSKIRGC